MTETTYRSDDELSVRLRAELAAERDRERESLEAARAIVVRRTARTTMGALGIAAGLVFLAVPFAALVDRSRMLDTSYPYGPPAERLLSALLVAMLVGYALGVLLGTVRFRRALEQPDPRRAVERVLERLIEPSFGWPLAAMILVLPLTLHFVAFHLWAGEAPRRLDWFDLCVFLSVRYAGMAHLAVAWCALRAGRELGRQLKLSPSMFAMWKGGQATLVAVVTAWVPAVLLLDSVPLAGALARVTGALFLPLTFYAAARRVTSERALLRGIGFDTRRLKA